MSGFSYTDEYLEFLHALDRHKIEYLLIGAYAVMIHTKVPRATKDMDTWIRQTRENAIKLSAALKEFGGLEVSEEAVLKLGQRIEIKSEAFKIEIWTSQEILGFEEAWERKMTDTVENFSINVISKEDLIKLKKHFNRPQDKMDLSLLQEKDL
ncbi:MAG: nucleotidyltransferase [Elusimicrobia bacterium]|nr:nucleotidyltransferase [Elusimicrobiota bacterium]